MTEKTDKKGYYHSAMYYGTLLGAVWSLMYILLFTGMTSPLLILGCIALFIGSPFIATAFARKYRRDECGNSMKYMQAWGFIYCMYICASLLSAVIMFLYLKYADNGMFFATIQKMLAAAMEMPGTDSAIREQIEATSQIIAETSVSDFVWQTLSNNILNASILPLIIAIFVRRNNKA